MGCSNGRRMTEVEGLPATFGRQVNSNWYMYWNPHTRTDITVFSAYRSVMEETPEAIAPVQELEKNNERPQSTGDSSTSNGNAVPISQGVKRGFQDFEADASQMETSIDKRQKVAATATNTPGHWERAGGCTCTFAQQVEPNNSPICSLSLSQCQQRRRR
ncbi:hypothetical protein BT63DRAFT_428192 [Microthyrium microscopicum]|uniref:Uncharacterized protein n=1 Tax=Microthyrium microscopicum TaxID=703497 RepID=A0A6A6U2A3_9PEZI|nr:hypothetical protein BT63DRAFT_428192 [Microthyrium microscopicum]